MELLKSENSGYGFYNEMDQAGCADAVWAAVAVGESSSLTDSDSGSVD